MLGADRSRLVLDSSEQTATGRADAKPDHDGLDDEWADYVPDPIVISEARRRELREEHERYIAELFEEIGEPSEEEMARAEAWWRPIEEHLTKNSSS